MKTATNNAESPIQHTRKLKGQMRVLLAHLHNDIANVNDGEARELFETAAETITVLVKAFEDYEKNLQEPWS